MQHKMNSQQPTPMNDTAPVIQLSPEQWELVRRYVGLARRSGQLLVGLERVKRSRKPLLVVTSSDHPLPATSVFLQLVPDSQSEPGLTVGRKNVKVVGLPDGKMARHIEQLIRRKD